MWLVPDRTPRPRCSVIVSLPHLTIYRQKLRAKFQVNYLPRISIIVVLVIMNRKRLAFHSVTTDLKCRDPVRGFRDKG